MAEQFDEFMDDVQKDMRQEHMQKMWLRYGRYATGAIIAILLGSTFLMMYNNKQQDKLLLTAEKFSRAQYAFSAGDQAKGLSILEHINTDDSKTYGALARITQARLMGSKGGDDFQKAQTLLRKLSEDKSIDVLFRDFALVTFVKNEIDAMALAPLADVAVDDAQRAKLMGFGVQLDSVSADTAPWYLMAMELRGLIYFLIKDYSKASETYVKIAQANGCPKGMQLRADLMTQQIMKKLKI